MTKVLFLHGSGVSGPGRKAEVLARHFNVRAPHLPFPKKDTWSWVEWVAMSGTRGRREAAAIAQELVDQFQPDVICGSSMGGALATTLQSDAALVLIAPACGSPGSYASPERLPARTIILHASQDWMVSPGNSRALLARHAPRSEAARAVVESIRTGLTDRGYAQDVPRLISIGSGHRCNDPHPGDTRNRNPDPLHAMVEAVSLLAGLPGV